MTTKPFFISLCCRPNGRQLGFGEPIEYAIRSMKPYFNHKHFWAFGINCVSLESCDQLFTRINAMLKKLMKKDEKVPRLLAYPNSGEVFSFDTYKWSGNSALEGDSLANEAVNWVSKHGVSIVGGCCRSTPEQIKAIHHKLRPEAKL